MPVQGLLIFYPQRLIAIHLLNKFTKRISRNKVLQKQQNFCNFWVRTLNFGSIPLLLPSSFVFSASHRPIEDGLGFLPIFLQKTLWTSQFLERIAAWLLTKTHTKAGNPSLEAKVNSCIKTGVMNCWCITWKLLCRINMSRSSEEASNCNGGRRLCLWDSASTVLRAEIKPPAWKPTVSHAQSCNSIRLR